MTKDQFDRVEANPDILVGKPVIRGTRVPVSLILNLLAHGYTTERITEAYPNLKPDDVVAALAYAEDVLDREEVVHSDRIEHA